MRIFILMLFSFCLTKVEAQNFFKKLAKDAGNTFTGAVRTTGNVYQESTAPFRNVSQDFYKNNFQKPVDNIKNEIVSQIPPALRDLYKYELENRIAPFVNTSLEIGTGETNIVDGTKKVYDHSMNILKEFALMPVLLELYTSARAASQPIPTDLLDKIQPYFKAETIRPFYRNQAKYIVSPKLIKILTGFGAIDADAITYYDVIIFKDPLSFKIYALKTLAHEMVHVAQYHDLGFSQFMAKYIEQNLHHNNVDTQIEKEAYKVGDNINAKLQAEGNLPNLVINNAAMFVPNNALSSVGLIESNSVNANETIRYAMSQAQAGNNEDEIKLIAGYALSSNKITAATKAYVAAWMANGPTYNINMQERLNWSKAAVGLEPENPLNWYFLAANANAMQDAATEFKAIINYATLIINIETGKAQPNIPLLINIFNLLDKSLGLADMVNWQGVQFYDQRLPLIMLIELGSYLPPDLQKDSRLNNYSRLLVDRDISVNKNDELRLRGFTAIAAGHLYWGYFYNRSFQQSHYPGDLANRRQAANYILQLVNNGLDFAIKNPTVSNKTLYVGFLNSLRVEANSLIQ
jgi:hypothetical protein